MRSERLFQWGSVLSLLAAMGGAGGCSTMNNTEKGVGLGAAAGAGVGTLIGAATHNPKTGAVVGALVGGATGGAIGNSMDREDAQKRTDQQVAAVANAQAVAAAQRMTIMDVAKMVQSGIDDQVVINQLRNTGSFFQLSPNDIQYLKAQGVSDRIIIEMQNLRPQPVVVQNPPPVVYGGPPPAVVVAQPPPVVVGGYYGYGGRYYYR